MAENVWDYFERPDYSLRQYEFINEIAKLEISKKELSKCEGNIPTSQLIDLFSEVQLAVDAYNEKVFSLALSYTLSRFYYEKNISGDPFSKDMSEGKGKTAYRYWFFYFAEMYYIKFFSLGDSFLEIFGAHCEYDLKPDITYRKELMRLLKRDCPQIAQNLGKIRNSKEYTRANSYRNAVAHKESLNAAHDVVVKVDSGVTMLTSGWHIEPSDVIDNIENLTRFCSLQYHKILQDLAEKMPAAKYE